MITPLRAARQKAGKKINEVAKACGMSEPTLSRIECDKQKASAEQAEKLSRYFGTVSEIEILYPERYSVATTGRRVKAA